jgi:hypothetical protein
MLGQQPIPCRKEELKIGTSIILTYEVLVKRISINSILDYLVSIAVFVKANSITCDLLNTESHSNFESDLEPNSNEQALGSNSFYSSIHPIQLI